jgi:hypothetical protein
MMDRVCGGCGGRGKVAGVHGLTGEERVSTCACCNGKGYHDGKVGTTSA